LYGVGPALVSWAVNHNNYRAPIAPLLWVLSWLAAHALLADPTFDPAAFWRLPDDNALTALVALRFAILSGALLWLGQRFAPEDFMQLPRRRPLLWLLLVVLYPTLSALPQGILWRVLFVHRYAALFDGRMSLLVAGALAFSFGHITYRSSRALAVTAVGGALFLDTYLRSHSMILAAAEHGAYGIVAFSAGLGRFMHMGRRWRAHAKATSP
jgi:hypothetical protein